MSKQAEDLHTILNNLQVFLQDMKLGSEKAQPTKKRFTLEHPHYRKQYTVKSRRPSTRHRVPVISRSHSIRRSNSSCSTSQSHSDDGRISDIEAEVAIAQVAAGSGDGTFSGTFPAGIPPPSPAITEGWAQGQHKYLPHNALEGMRVNSKYMGHGINSRTPIHHTRADSQVGSECAGHVIDSRTPIHHTRADSQVGSECAGHVIDSRTPIHHDSQLGSGHVIGSRTYNRHTRPDSQVGSSESTGHVINNRTQTRPDSHYSRYSSIHSQSSRYRQVHITRNQKMDTVTPSIFTTAYPSPPSHETLQQKPGASSGGVPFPCEIERDGSGEVGHRYSHGNVRSEIGSDMAEQWSGNTCGGNLGPRFRDFHAVRQRSQRKCAYVQHRIIAVEVECTREDQSEDGNKISPQKVSLQRRETSKRNKNKFTMRRKALERSPSSCSHEDGSESNELEAISVQDINIILDKPESEEEQVESTHTIDPIIEVEDDRRDKISPTFPRLATIYTRQRRKPRTRQVRVQMRRRRRKIIVIGDMSSGKTNLISAYAQDRFSENYTPTILHCYQTDSRICGELIELVVIEISGRDDFEPLRRRAYHKVDAAMICYSVDNASSFHRISDFWVPELRKYAPKVPFVLVGTKRDMRDHARDCLEEDLRVPAQHNEEVSPQHEVPQLLTPQQNEEGNERQLTQHEVPQLPTIQQNEEGTEASQLVLTQQNKAMIARIRAEVSFNERFVPEDRGKRMAADVGALGFMECSALYRDRTREVFETVTRVALKKSRRVRQDNRHLNTMCNIL